ncbi:hypothetical protein KY389_13690 [Paracoccus bogoriensis]|uniref:hypothetical protein n=1 Tax=Paracoccus bogoriensis TaxID=242065 RepID=UPI001CA4817A|nr:hypothetical protein [Paracoccus bogoriensis]MBW7057724.1 hypothetical protein [Paracoccus bogoriensis]
MKAFAAAVVFAVIVAYGASHILNANFQSAAYSAFTTEGARVDNPGSNLLGN